MGKIQFTSLENETEHPAAALVETIKIMKAAGNEMIWPGAYDELTFMVNPTARRGTFYINGHPFQGVCISDGNVNYEARRLPVAYCYEPQSGWALLF